MADKILVTGAAGFIGFHLSRRLLNEGFEVFGIDNLSINNDIQLKYERLGILLDTPNFSFLGMDLLDQEGISYLFGDCHFDMVVNLAALKGDKNSDNNPYPYIDNNITGFINLLESCRRFPVKHLLYASSGSAHGSTQQMPFCDSQKADHPDSLYAFSKKANELMANTYSHLHRVPCSGLRFSDVFGPWSQPDSTLNLFAQAIEEGKPINIYDHSDAKRDFIFINDAVEGVTRLIHEVSKSSPNPAKQARHQIYNIGNDQPVLMTDFISALESALGKKARKNILPYQPGEGEENKPIHVLSHDKSLRFKTPLKQGMAEFVQWYRDYNQLDKEYTQLKHQAVKASKSHNGSVVTPETK